MSKIPYSCIRKKVTPVECDPCDYLESRVEALETATAELEADKLEVSNIEAGDNITLDVDGNQITINASGGSGSVTKEEILSALGYDEVIFAFTDGGGDVNEWYVLAQPVSIPPTPPSPPDWQTWIEGDPMTHPGNAQAAVTQSITFDATLPVASGTDYKVIISDVEVGGVSIGTVQQDGGYDGQSIDVPFDNTTVFLHIYPLGFVAQLINPGGETLPVTFSEFEVQVYV